MKRLRIALLGFVAVLGITSVAQAGSTYGVGDVFVAVGSGKVQEYTPTGTLVQTMDTGLGGFTTGMGFDNAGNLYVTDFSSNVSEFNNSGTLVNASFIGGGAQSTAESLAFGASGNIFVGDAGLNVINEYSSAGGSSPIHSTTALTQDRGTDWIDLQGDQQTVLYTSEGTSILSVNTATNLQNAAFATSLPGSTAYALREIPTGAFAGDVLVADSQNAYLVAPGGAIVKTYILPGNLGGDFALNLDPNGTDFWTSDFNSSQVWEVNIATGAIDNMWTTAITGSDFGLVVFGQITASGGGGGTNPTPEPSTLVLLASGLLAFAAIGGLTKFRLPQPTSLR
jgi:hypothetical protein